MIGGFFRTPALGGTLRRPPNTPYTSVICWVVMVGLWAWGWFVYERFWGDRTFQKYDLPFC
jgi:hypothetical protein